MGSQLAFPESGPTCSSPRTTRPRFLFFFYSTKILSVSVDPTYSEDSRSSDEGFSLRSQRFRFCDPLLTSSFVTIPKRIPATPSRR